MRSTRILLTVCILILTSVHSSAQRGKALTGDTAFWYRWQMGLEERLNLVHLSDTRDSIYFRFFIANQVIDLSSEDGKLFSGFITNYTWTYHGEDNREHKRKSRLISKKQQIDTATARRVFELTRNISAIPSDGFIKGWDKGLDGVTHIFEASSPTVYSFKTYWTPTAQDSTLPEAKAIVTFVRELDTLLGLHILFTDFFSRLRGGAYRVGGCVWGKPSRKNARYYLRNKSEFLYLKAVGDTLNNYLTDTLTKILGRNEEPSNLDVYHLKFSPANRLVKIEVKHYFFDKESKREARKYRKRIRKAFKKVRFEFVHSKIAYWKILKFRDKNIVVY